MNEVAYDNKSIGASIKKPILIRMGNIYEHAGYSSTSSE